MQVRYSKKEEKIAALDAWKKSFKDSNEEIDFYFKNIFNHQNYLVLEENQKIVSSLHENPYILNFFSNEISSRYIVGVSTLITEQRKGYMSNLIKTMLSNLKAKKIPLVFLTPINSDIYRKFQFEYFSKIEILKFKIDNLSSFNLDKSLNFIEVTEENKREFINGLMDIYDHNMKSRVSFLKRDEYYFNKLLAECLNENKEIYISYRNNSPESYIIFSKENDTLEIREIFSKNYESSESTLALLYKYKDYYENIVLNTTINSNLEFLFKNQINIEKNIAPFMMMRILEPLILLNMSFFKLEGLSILIEDNILKENTGLYSFSKKWEFSTENKSYHFKINIGDLVFLLTGFFSFEDLISMKKVVLNKIDNEFLEKLKAIKKLPNSYLYEFQ